MLNLELVLKLKFGEEMPFTAWRLSSQISAKCKQLILFTYDQVKCKHINGESFIQELVVRFFRTPTVDEANRTLEKFRTCDD